VFNLVPVRALPGADFAGFQTAAGVDMHPPNQVLLIAGFHQDINGTAH
jgi:hypothetical protein